MAAIVPVLFLCLVSISLGERGEGTAELSRFVDDAARLITHSLNESYRVCVMQPARFFYVWFPAMPGGLGGWGGLSAPEICAALTGIRSSHWTETSANRQECEAHLDRRAFSFVVALAAAGYLYLLVCTWRAVEWTASCLLRSILSRSCIGARDAARARHQPGAEGKHP